MRKAELKIEDVLSVVGPSAVVRILDETMTPTGNFVDIAEITVTKGPAAKIRRDLAGRGMTVKLIDPAVEVDNGRFCLRVWVYPAAESGAET